MARPCSMLFVCRAIMVTPVAAMQVHHSMMPWSSLKVELPIHNTYVAVAIAESTFKISYSWRKLIHHKNDKLKIELREENL